MKINEVEARVGITKKNIRFYEAEHLLTPQRNIENGYRDYSEADVETLCRIKLLRKLGFPLEEIRQMQSGARTVGDGMRRHLITLEREQDNLSTAAQLCSELSSRQEKLDMLDAKALLEHMEHLEQGGATFMNKQKHDVRKRYIAPVVAAIVMSALMVATIWLFLWAFKVDPLGAPPLPLLVVLLAAPAVVILGVLIAMLQRLREIERGEIDDAKNY